MINSTIKEIYENVGGQYNCCELFHTSGNRFFLFVNSLSEEEAIMVYGDKIACCVRNHVFGTDDKVIDRTLSVTVAVYMYDIGMSVERIVSNAHQPLFYAKHNGKNQVIS